MPLTLGTTGTLVSNGSFSSISSGYNFYKHMMVQVEKVTYCNVIAILMRYFV